MAQIIGGYSSVGADPGGAGRWQKKPEERRPSIAAFSAKAPRELPDSGEARNLRPDGDCSALYVSTNPISRRLCLGFAFQTAFNFKVLLIRPVPVGQPWSGHHGYTDKVLQAFQMKTL